MKSCFLLFSVSPGLPVGRLAAEDLVDRCRDIRHLGQNVSLHDPAGDGVVLRADPHDGGVQGVEGLLHDLHGNLARRPAPEHVLLHEDHPPRLPDGLYDGVDIEGLQGPRIDHLHAHALRLELLRHLEAPRHHEPDGHDGHVLPFLLHVRHAEGDRVFLIRHLPRRRVQQLVLEEAHRVVVPDRRLEQALRIVRRRRDDDLHPRQMEDRRERRPGMVGPEVDIASHGEAVHDGDLHPAAVGELPDGGVLDLVHADVDEVGEHKVRDGAESRQGRAEARTGDGRLADGRIDDPVLPVFLDQPARDAEQTDRYVLADEVNRLVPRHFLIHGLIDSCGKCNLFHGGHLSVCIQSLEHFVRVGHAAGHGFLFRLVDVSGDFLVDLLRIGGGKDATLDQLGPEQGDGVLRQPLGNFLLRHRLRAAQDGDALVVGPETVCLALHEGRALACPGALHGAHHRLRHGHHILPVDHHAGHAIAVREIGDVLARRACRHGHEDGQSVVLADPHDGELHDRRHVEGLVEGPPAGSAVAEVGDHNGALALLLAGNPHADGKGKAGTDGAAGTRNAQFQVRRVEPRPALAAAGRFAAVLRIHFLCRHALGHRLHRAVGADAAHDPVVLAQEGHPSHRRRLIALPAVPEPRHLALHEALHHHLVHLPDDNHVPVKLQ